MSEVKMTETITVLQVSKYGVRVGDQWYNINSPLSPTNFLPNKTYTVAIKVSKNGKKYISEIVSTEKEESKEVVKASADRERAQRVINSIKASSSNPVDSDKDKRIQRQGCYQAALQSPYPVTVATNIDEYLALVKRLAESGVDFINEK